MTGDAIKLALDAAVRPSCRSNKSHRRDESRHVNLGQPCDPEHRRDRPAAV